MEEERLAGIGGKLSSWPACLVADHQLELWLRRMAAGQVFLQH